MTDLPPQPPPLFIELAGDRFIVSPHVGIEAIRSAAVAKTLAMTPEERLDWHERWRQFIRACERRGDSIQQIEAAV
jgi:hypothetical protein